MCKNAKLKVQSLKFFGQASGAGGTKFKVQEPPDFLKGDPSTPLEGGEEFLPSVFRMTRNVMVILYLNYSTEI